MEDPQQPEVSPPQPGPGSRVMSSAAWPVLVGAAAAVVLIVMHEMRSVLGQALLAYFIALAVSPLVAFFKRRRAPDWLGVLLAMLIVVAVIAAILVISAVSLSSIQSELPKIEQKVAAQQAALRRAGLLRRRPRPGLGDLHLARDRGGHHRRVAGWLASGLTFSFLLLFIVLYMLLDSYEIGRSCSAT
jgi:AI-2 transport protein TqsA